MSGILNRQLLVDRSKGRWDWHDMAIVATGVGVCMEPGIAWERVNIGAKSNFDPEDDMTRVDGVVEVERGRIGYLFGGAGGTSIHGMICMPRLRY
jgi:hypothetical protein